ncbi:MAG: hypothetical protein HXO19_08325 [Prevotella shahii]|uniref:hypothetical protein n=1 Tax=Hoylesella shahii TaxID=228603 RepID=UPI001CAE70F3|nr:hypothetical protein [Hoylesella shahii]MBF1591087.1 hypothetical protein [Hoylesella shahii]
MKRKIVVTAEVKQKLMKQFGAGERSLFNALMYDERRGNSPTAKRIRESAMKNGGVSMADDCLDMETIHLADGTMRQFFPRGTVMTVFRNGVVTIEKNGRLVKKEQCPGLIDDYEELQRLAAKVDGAERVTVLR